MTAHASPWLRSELTHYVAIIEDAGPDHAIGVWFPDLPGCFSAGDTLDQAMKNAPEALALWFEGHEEEGRAIPRARTPSELKADPKSPPIWPNMRLR